MSYRIHDRKPPKPQRSVVDITTPMRAFVHNGCTTDLAIPCWYQEIRKPVRARLHDKHLHDHQGWPSPMHHGHSCQLWVPEDGSCVHGVRECHPHCRHYIDYSKVIPIHLSSEYEGYEGAFVSWVGSHEGITATASIDDKEDWVVKVHVDCQDPNALEEPKKYKFTVFVGSDEVGGKYTRRAIVALVELTVLPSAY